jgi:hypothetical protein
MEVQHCPLFNFANSLYKFRASNTSIVALHNRDIWYPMSSSQKGRLALAGSRPERGHRDGVRLAWHATKWSGKRRKISFWLKRLHTMSDRCGNLEIDASYVP